ncbi:MAG TPA: formate dehydrogenase accessory sulfurtransferase FdhD [Saprospiraceae bacterium]
MNVKKYNGLFFNNGKFSPVRDILSVEIGLSISINNVPFTVTMQTPGQEKDLVRGLLFSESIYRDLDIHPKLEATGINEDGYITAINLTIPEHMILKDFAGTRNVMSASSCGLCGKTTFDEVSEAVIINHDILDPTVIALMFDQMSEKQKSFQQSGGTHAAGAFTLDGTMLSIREDIGRHNAVDKVIGDLIYNHRLSQVKCLTVSGRISFEIVSKAISAGIPYLASVSAPSTMAVDMAEQAGMTLMAFCRNNKLTVYSNTGRVRTDDLADAAAPVNRKENV